MKRLSIFLSLILLVTTAFAEDNIIKTNGSSIECQVVEVGTKEVFYSMPGKAKPLYAIEKKDIETIIYEDGKQDHFISSVSDMPNFPNDQKSEKSDKVAKQLKQIKWIMLANSIVNGILILAALTK